MLLPGYARGALLALALLLASCGAPRAPLPSPALAALLVQPGDLPATLQPGPFATAPPARYAALTLPLPLWVAGLTLNAVDGPPIALPVGQLIVSVYTSPATAQAAFSTVVQGITHEIGAGTPQPLDGLGDEARGYADAMLANSAFTRIAFARCAALVDLDLWGEVTPAGATAYAQRLDRRLQATGVVGCRPAPPSGTTWAVLGREPPQGGHSLQLGPQAGVRRRDEVQPGVRARQPRAAPRSRRSLGAWRQRPRRL